MVFVPLKESALADQANDFAQSIAPAKERWLYCLRKATHTAQLRDGSKQRILDSRAFPVCDRLIGCYSGVAASRLGRLRELGWDGANAWVNSRTWLAERPYFYVGPIQPWHVGHVYVARVESHPHVVKIGFSRRVHSRLEDIESKMCTRLYVEPEHLMVGTLADEHWWHYEMKASRITGEWFFDSSVGERSLPHFLAAQMEAA